MDYIKIRFSNSIDQFQSELGRTIDHLFRTTSPMFAQPSQCFRPQMDIHETPDEIIVISEIAGVLKEDLEVEVDPRAIRIHGRRMETPRHQDTRFHLAEIPYGRFDRVVYLPCLVEPENVSASYTNGLLQVKMQKRKCPSPQRVTVQEL